MNLPPLPVRSIRLTPDEIAMMQAYARAAQKIALEEAARHGPVSEQLMSKFYGPRYGAPSKNDAVSIRGVWLRAEGIKAVVLVEREDGNWYRIIEETAESPFSHICEVGGILNAPIDLPEGKT